MTRRRSGALPEQPPYLGASDGAAVGHGVHGKDMRGPGPVSLKSPFPWFGGKSRAAAAIWARFGDVAIYVEPFAGSLAVLLARPHPPRIETVNDADCYLANFWRCFSAMRWGFELTGEQHAAIAQEVARWADWPVNEADLHARHRWLVFGRDGDEAPSGANFRERMRSDPDYFDPKIAGWWVWGLCAWIGSGWCAGGRAAAAESPRECGDGGPPIQLPHLGNGGMGVHRKLPHLGDAGRGDPRDADAPLGRSAIYEVFAALAERLRYTRVACGNWDRIVTDSVTWRHGTTAVLLDPPYSDEVRASGIYAVDSGDVATDVLRWCVEHGGDHRLRIALCGYDNEGHGNTLESMGWRVHAWKANGGYGGQRRDRENDNAARERIWFSPGCLTLAPPAQPSLFAGGLP